MFKTTTHVRYEYIFIRRTHVIIELCPESTPVQEVPWIADVWIWDPTTSSPDETVDWTHTHTQTFYGSMDFVRDNPGERVPEETFTHSHLSWSSPLICFIHLIRSTATSQTVDWM